MVLQAALRDHYWEKGWVVVDGVFPAERARAIAELATQIAERDLEKQLLVAPAGVGRSYFADSSESGELAPRKVTRPSTSIRSYAHWYWIQS